MAELEAKAVAERMADRLLQNEIEPGWPRAPEPVAGRIKEIDDFLRAELAAGRVTCWGATTSCAPSGSRSPTCAC